MRDFRSRWSSDVLFRGAAATWAVALLAIVLIAADRGTAPSSYRHPSGILVLTGGRPGVSMDGDVRRALTMARGLSESNPEHFTYAYVDPSDGTVRLGAVDDEGIRLARQTDVPVRSLPGARSRAELEKVMDAVIGEQTEGVLVLSSHPEASMGVVLLEIDRLDDEFLHRIARTHGSDTVAIRVVGPSPGSGPA